MGIFSDLDIVIQDNCSTPQQYKALKKEINQHVHGIKSLEQLSPGAQTCIIQWEELERICG